MSHGHCRFPVGWWPCRLRRLQSELVPPHMHKGPGGGGRSELPAQEAMVIPGARTARPSFSARPTARCFPGPERGSLRQQARRGSSHSEEEVSAKSQDSTYGPVPRLLHSFQNQTAPPPQARPGLLCPPGGQQLGPFSQWRVRLRSLTLTPLVLEFVRFFPTPLKNKYFLVFPFNNTQAECSGEACGSLRRKGRPALLVRKVPGNPCGATFSVVEEDVRLQKRHQGGTNPREESGSQ